MQHHTLPKGFLVEIVISRAGFQSQSMLHRHRSVRNMGDIGNLVVAFFSTPAELQEAGHCVCGILCYW